MKTITIEKIQAADRTFRGQHVPGSVAKDHLAEIVPGKSVRLHGIKDVAPKYTKKDGAYVPETPRCKLHPECLAHEEMAIECLKASPENEGKELYDITFNVGDPAEYDSYNLQYLGIITAITAKTVTIVDHGRAHRLGLYEFDRRNHRFDLDAITERNNETMMVI